MYHGDIRVTKYFLKCRLGGLWLKQLWVIKVTLNFVKCGIGRHRFYESWGY